MIYWPHVVRIAFLHSKYSDVAQFVDVATCEIFSGFSTIRKIVVPVAARNDIAVYSKSD